MSIKKRLKQGGRFGAKLGSFVGVCAEMVTYVASIGAGAVLGASLLPAAPLLSGAAGVVVGFCAIRGGLGDVVFYGVKGTHAVTGAVLGGALGAVEAVTISPLKKTFPKLFDFKTQPDPEPEFRATPAFETPQDFMSRIAPASFNGVAQNYGHSGVTPRQRQALQRQQEAMVKRLKNQNKGV